MPDPEPEIPYGEVESSQWPPRIMRMPLWKLVLLALPSILLAFTAGLLAGLWARCG